MHACELLAFHARNQIISHRSATCRKMWMPLSCSESGNSPVFITLQDTGESCVRKLQVTLPHSGYRAKAALVYRKKRRRNLLAAFISAPSKCRHRGIYSS